MTTIECPQCKKQINRDLKQCEFCGREIRDEDLIVHFHKMAHKYDNKRCFLILVISWLVCGLFFIKLRILDPFIKNRILPESPLYNTISIILFSGTVVTCIALWIYYSQLMTIYRQERDALMDDQHEICANCGRYKLKNEDCVCRDMR